MRDVAAVTAGSSSKRKAAEDHIMDSDDMQQKKAKTAAAEQEDDPDQRIDEDSFEASQDLFDSQGDANLPAKDSAESSGKATKEADGPVGVQPETDEENVSAEGLDRYALA